MMKKLIALLLVLCVAGMVLAACAGNETPAVPEEVQSEEPAVEPEETAIEPEETGETEPQGLERLYALHDPDEVVMTIGDTEIPWRDYFYFYYSQASQLEQQFQMYQAYGMAIGWNTEADEEGHTYAELMGPNTEETLRQLLAVEQLAEELGVELTEEEEEAIQQSHRELITARFGEEGTEEQLYESLESIYVSPELYWRINRYSYLYDACYRNAFGENGELLDEQEVLAWMEENGIVSVNHILISTDELEEEEAEARAALARQIADELQALEDGEERLARFLELQEQYNEDPGTVANGYVFGPGVMVTEFYDASLALEEGQISDPVATNYGYHIILRRPLHADDEIFTGDYVNYSGRVYAASEQFNRLLEEKLESLQTVYAEGFTTPNLLDYIDQQPAADR